MIKLIASDIDGTLIPYGQTGLPQGLFPLIRRLTRAGILFCPASGRQYHSLRQLFAPVAEELCFLCENGGVVFGPAANPLAPKDPTSGAEAVDPLRPKASTAAATPAGEGPVLSKTPFPRDVALALSRDIAALPGCKALISGERVGYVCGGDTTELRKHLEQNVCSKIFHVEDPAEITEDIVKVSVYCPGGPEEPVKALGPKWGKWNMAVAGPIWLDFGVADKGTGIRGLCEALSIAPEEVAAFGDNWNDTAMLSAVGHPYLMETADPQLLARYPRHCSDVLTEIETILAENGEN